MSGEEGDDRDIAEEGVEGGEKKEYKKKKIGFPNPSSGVGQQPTRFRETT